MKLVIPRSRFVRPAGALLLLLAASLLPAAGQVDAAKEKSIRAFLESIEGVIEDGDEAKFKALFTGPAEYDPLVDAMYQASRSTAVFKQALIKKDGPDAWEKYREAKPPEGQPQLTLNSGNAFEGDISMKDGKYQVQSPNGVAIVVPNGDSWQIEAQSLLPPGAQLEPLTQFLGVMTQVANYCTELVETKDLPYGELKVESFKKLQSLAPKPGQ